MPKKPETIDVKARPSKAGEPVYPLMKPPSEVHVAETDIEVTFDAGSVVEIIDETTLLIPKGTKLGRIAVGVLPHDALLDAKKGDRYAALHPVIITENGCACCEPDPTVN